MPSNVLFQFFIIIAFVLIISFNNAALSKNDTRLTVLSTVWMIGLALLATTRFTLFRTTNDMLPSFFIWLSVVMSYMILDLYLKNDLGNKQMPYLVLSQLLGFLVGLTIATRDFIPTVLAIMPGLQIGNAYYNWLCGLPYETIDPKVARYTGSWTVRRYISTASIVGLLTYYLLVRFVF